MAQINFDYYEDLTPENFKTLLEDLRHGRPVKTGSQIGRSGSEPEGGGETLKDPALYDGTVIGAGDWQARVTEQRKAAAEAAAAKAAAEAAAKQAEAPEAPKRCHKAETAKADATPAAAAQAGDGHGYARPSETVRARPAERRCAGHALRRGQGRCASCGKPDRSPAAATSR